MLFIKMSAYSNIQWEPHTITTVRCIFLRHNFIVPELPNIFTSVIDSIYVYMCVCECNYIAIYKLICLLLKYIPNKQKHPSDCTRLYGLNIDL